MLVAYLHFKVIGRPFKTKKLKGTHRRTGVLEGKRTLHMGSSSALKIPSVDFSELGDSEPGSCGWDSVQDAVRRALEEYGCFEALYDKVTLELHDDVFNQTEEMFNLPAETKRRLINPTKPLDGYLADLPRYPPLSETMGMRDALETGVIERFADVLWPEGNVKFCELLNTYLRRISELDYLIKKMVFRSFGVEHYLDLHAESTTYTLRHWKYGAPKTEEDQAGITHCDLNFLTILQQSHVNALEVQTKDGDWIQVTPAASSSIVMIGEAFHGWINGRLHCPRHRVMMRGNEVRYSIGIFAYLNGTIRCPDELVDEQHPLLFKPFDADGLFRVLATPEFQNGASGLKTFYSVSD